MHKLTYIVLCLSSVTSIAQTQSDTIQTYKPNAIYVELGGNGFIYSLNFDHKFAQHASWRIGARVLPMRGGNLSNSFLLLPTMINYLAGSGNSRFELGAGLLHGFHSIGYFLSGTATIGYRYQPMKGGFNFRIGFTPLISGYGILPWVGISLGYGF